MLTIYGNIKSPELLKPRPLAVPHYGVKWAELSYLLPVSLGLMSGEAPTAWLLDQALLLLFPRPGQGLLLPSPPSSVSTLSLHTACEFAVIFWTIWVSWKPYFHHPFHWSCGKMPSCLTTLGGFKGPPLKTVKCPTYPRVRSLPSGNSSAALPPALWCSPQNSSG